MELDAEELPLPVLDCGIGAGRGAGRLDEAFRKPGDPVAMAHPDLTVGGDALEDGAVGLQHVDVCDSVFLVLGALYKSSQQLAHDLEAIADAEDGQAHVEEPLVRSGAAGGRHGGRASGEDDALHIARSQDVLRRAVERQDLRIDSQFPDAACDQLAVLRPEVEDDDRVMSLAHWSPILKMGHQPKCLTGGKALTTASLRAKPRTAPTVLWMKLPGTSANAASKPTRNTPEST